MSYSQRVSIATGVSILAHLLLLWAGLSRVEAIPKRDEAVNTQPIVFNLQPPPAPEPEPEPETEQRVRTVIETPNPTNEPVEDTDLISNNNSKAMDQSDKTGDRQAPASENADDFDQVELKPTPEPQSSPPQPMIVPPPQPQPEQVPETEPVEEKREIPEQRAEATKPTDATVVEKLDREMTEAREETTPEEPKEDVQTPERFEVAQATPPPTPQIFEQDIREGRTRGDGGTDESGVLNFEAREHELGEYMLHVRRKVERQWRTAIRLKYASVRHAEARVKLSIRPDGTIAAVEILDDGNALPFAALSREAVWDAGPFDPLPFDVPEFYRSRNLDITWRFSYN